MDKLIKNRFSGNLKETFDDIKRLLNPNPVKNKDQ